MSSFILAPAIWHFWQMRTNFTSQLNSKPKTCGVSWSSFWNHRRANQVQTKREKTQTCEDTFLVKMTMKTLEPRIDYEPWSENFACILIRVFLGARAAKSAGIGELDSSIAKDLIDNPKHTLFCRKIAFAAIYALFKG